MPTLAEAIDAVNFDLDPVPDQIHGSSAGATPYVIDYQFESSDPADLPTPTNYTGWTAFTEAEKAVFRQSLDYIETIINVDYQEVSGSADPTMNVGKVNLGGGTAGVGGFNFSYASNGGPWYLTDWDSFTVFKNTITLDSGETHLILHEVAHALGLKHSFSSEGGTDAVLTGEFDSNKYTVTSYTANPDNGLDSDGYQLYDIAALQQRWGANMNTATGNDVYNGPRNSTVDVIWDAGGTDTLDASAKTNNVILNLNEGTFSRFGAVDDVAIAYGVTIEHATGGSGADVITGNSGKNSLKGGAGDDMLSGGFGHDMLWGGAGADQHIGGSGLDYARYDDAVYGDIIVSLSDPSRNTNVAAGDTFDGIEGIITGGGKDRLTGNDGDNYLVGGRGNDMLSGGKGADVLNGGYGFDYARYDDANHGDLTVSLVNTSINTGAAVGDKFIGIEGLVLGAGNDTGQGSGAADYIFGMGGNDVLSGQAGNDRLNGGSGIDRLVGGRGDDRLTGGSQADVFVFRENYDKDIIWDYSGSEGQGDRIDVRGAFSDFAAIDAVMSQSGADVEIMLNAEDVLTVRNYDETLLDADDFIF